MQLSTKGRCAVMAMVDLAKRQTADRPADRVCLADIALRQQLSQSYLEQLFGKLRRADLVDAARGPRGGYRLARPAANIAIAEIVAAVDDPIKPTPDASPAPAAPPSHTHDLWFELGRRITLFLRGITLADVAMGRVTGRDMGAPRSRPATVDRDANRDCDAQDALDY